MEEVDVLIVGGGPAGLAAGIACGLAGLRALVCEAQALPVDKACGEGVMPSGLAALRRLGAAPLLSTSDYSPFAGIRYLTSDGRSAEADFREGPGWGIRRTALSEALARRLAAMPGVEVRDRTPVLRFRREKERIQAQAGGEWVSARLLVGADGLSSRVRAWAGLDGLPPSFQRWGARQHFDLRPWSPYVEIHWGPGIEAYVTPCGDQVGIAFLWDRRRFKPPAGGPRLIPSLLGLFPALQERLAGAGPCSEMRAVGPLQRNAAGPAAPGIALLGDASGYLDALTGEGLSLAFHQAEALAAAAAPLAAGLPMDLDAYRRAHRRILRPYLSMTRLVLFLSERPALVGPAVGLLDRWPRLFQALLSANMGIEPGSGT